MCRNVQSRPQEAAGRAQCVSPIESAKLELEELRSEFPQLRTKATPGGGNNQHLLLCGSGQQEGGESRSVSLPSFPQSFQKTAQKEGDQLSIQGLSEILAYDESGLDDLDEEIKMIVARGEAPLSSSSKLPFPTADDVLTVLKQCETKPDIVTVTSQHTVGQF